MLVTANFDDHRLTLILAVGGGLERSGLEVWRRVGEQFLADGTNFARGERPACLESDSVYQSAWIDCHCCGLSWVGS
jgi:hypothetical protein